MKRRVRRIAPPELAPRDIDEAARENERIDRGRAANDSPRSGGDDLETEIEEVARKEARDPEIDEWHEPPSVPPDRLRRAETHPPLFSVRDEGDFPLPFVAAART